MFEFITEPNRQEVSGDDKFVTHPPYYFELVVPASVGIGGVTNFVFPLVISPEFYALDEPFALQSTPTGEAGLFVEENGIIERTIRITGHTGFKPRPYKADQILENLITKDERSYSRDVVRRVQTDISGQRHFQFLQDAIFRTYADLKRDPTTAAETKLFFHNVKDDEHWQVFPAHFSLSRDKSRPLLYHYDIQLLAVKGKEKFKVQSEDKSFFDQVKDAIRTVSSAIDTCNAAVRSLTSVIGEIKSYVRTIDTLIANTLDIVNSAANFLAGVTDLIQLPAKIVENTKDEWSRAIENIETQAGLLAATVTGSEPRSAFPDSTINAMRRVNDGLNLMSMHSEVFETPIERAIREGLRRSELTVGYSASALLEAEDEPPPKNFTQVKAMGTRLENGDRLRARAELGLGRNQKRYSSAQERVIEQGDSLPSLAARYLGDARLWRHIAVLNNLRPPYISEHGAPNTLSIGDTVLVPTDASPVERAAPIATLGTKLEDSLENQLLGIDLAMEASSTARGYYDVAIDMAGGATDVKVVRGIKNLEQAIGTRVRTERGTDILYRNLGVQRVVGVGIDSVGVDFAKFRVAEAVEADARLASTRVRNLTVADSAEKALIQSADILAVDLECEVRNLTRKLRIRSEV